MRTPLRRPSGAARTAAALALAAAAVAGSPLVADATAAAPPRPAVTVLLRGEEGNATGAWSRSFVVLPHQRIKLLAEYRNTSRTTQRQVRIRLSLPRGFRLVNSRALFVNALHRRGWPASAAALVHGGIVIGDYAPGANGYVQLAVQLPAATHMPCGNPGTALMATVAVAGATQVRSTLVLRIHHPCPTARMTVTAPA